MNYNIGVLISGDGSNLNAIINNGINVKFVVSNNQNARGLLIAKKNLFQQVPSWVRGSCERILLWSTCVLGSVVILEYIVDNEMKIEFFV